MNFKRYHVSKNLFDISAYTSYTTGISDIVTTTNSITYTASSAFLAIRYFFPLDTTDIFTIKLGSESSNVRLELRYRKNGSTVGDAIIVTIGNSYVIRGSEDVDEMQINISNGTNTDTCKASNIMLNTGSAPLPYEPYSSEVWHDIPYYQHKTATDTLTLPAVIYPNDTSITVGIKGQSSQSGTPSPSNPVDVNGTGDMSSNLFDISTWNNATATRGTISISENTVTLTASGNDCYSDTYAQSKYNISVTGGETYTLSWETDYKSGILYVFTGTSVAATVLILAQSSKKSTTFTVPENHTSLSFRLGVSTAGEVGVYSNIMLNVGEEALPYEPFGYKIPILLNSQTINKYLGTEQTTRRIRKMRLVNPSSRTTTSKGYTRLTFNISEHVAPVYSKGGGYCNIASWQGNYNEIGFVAQEFTMFITQDIPEWGTLEGATEWLNSNEVYVWYVLANETTATVNEPLMKIGNYSDSLTTSIPVTAGENTLDVQTTVQSSEVTAGFSGWHPITEVHERESGQWD